MRSKVTEVAFERAVREHHAAVYGTAMRILRDEASALDATQQTFLKVLDGRIDLARLDEVGRALRCVAAREALMLLRSDRNRKRREQEHAMQRTERTSDASIEDQEMFAALGRALGELPEDLRQALVLRFQVGLTFAEVGGALSISESSAHQRVQRGVEMLREQFARLGFAAAMIDPAEMLAREALPTAPSGVETALLALNKGALTWILSWPVVAASVAAAALVTIASMRSGRAQSARETALVAADEHRREITTTSGSSTGPNDRVSISVGAGMGAGMGPAEGESAALATILDDPDARAAKFATAFVEGRVVDVVGIAVEGAEVFAGSIESGGKSPQYSSIAKTDAAGRFRLELAVGVASGQDYALTVSTPTFHQRVCALRAKPGETAPYQRVQLAEELTDRPGHWDLAVRVIGGDGRAIGGAYVYVQHPVRWVGGDTWLERDTGGATEASGVVHLTGTSLGPKLVQVDARAQGFAPHAERLSIDADGHIERVVTVEPGVSLVGTILDERGEPLSAKKLGMEFVKLYATSDDPNDWLEARLPETGRFEVPALTRTSHTLHFRGDPWSSFTRVGVMPGAPVEVRLKLKTDVTDTGTHDAELHGEILDAATGAPIDLDVLDVWVESIASDSPALVDHDFGVMGLVPRIAQVMMIEPAEDAPPRPPPHMFVLDGLARGTYVVCVNCDGYAPALVGPIELGEREIRGGLDVRLARGVTIEGIVLDTSGKPLENAVVTELGQGELSRRALAKLDEEVRATDARGRWHSPGVRTDAKGRFTLKNVPIDRALHLVALHSGFEPLETAQIEVGTTPISGRELRFTRARAR